METKERGAAEIDVEIVVVVDLQVRREAHDQLIEAQLGGDRRSGADGVGGILENPTGLLDHLAEPLDLGVDALILTGPDHVEVVGDGLDGGEGLAEFVREVTQDVDEFGPVGGGGGGVQASERRRDSVYRMRGAVALGVILGGFQVGEDFDGMAKAAEIWLSICVAVWWASPRGLMVGKRRWTSTRKRSPVSRRRRPW